MLKCICTIKYFACIPLNPTYLLNYGVKSQYFTLITCYIFITCCNFNRKNQVTLPKLTDDSGKWHFLALPSILDKDGVKRPTKSLSRLTEGIASKSHSDFYCYGCFHSFCAESTLKKHVELCKYNDFCKIELPEGDKNIKQYEQCKLC